MIVGTALGGLAAAAEGNNGRNNGLLGNLFGNNNPDVVTIPTPMPVTEHQYYEDSIRDMRWYFNDHMCGQRKYYEDSIANQKDFFDYAQGVSERICNLEQRVAVDETSIAKNFEFMANENAWQNKFFDEKMRYADLLEQCRIEQATCKCIKGQVYASPADLADPYSGRRQVIGSYTEPLCGYSNGYGYFNNGCGGYNNGCNGGWGWGYNNGNNCGCGCGF